MTGLRGRCRTSIRQRMAETSLIRSSPALEVNQAGIRTVEADQTACIGQVHKATEQHALIEPVDP